MLSIEAISDESFPVCLLTKVNNRGKTKVKEIIYYTEPTRANNSQKISFENQIKEYLIRHDNGHYKFKEQYKLEMVPTITTKGKTQPRFINFYLSASNSGKSYQIAQLCRNYLEMFPDNLIAYASANPIDNDVNYADIKDKIFEVDVLNLESTIDFSNPRYRNSLWIFDDCDSGFSASMEDLDTRLTPEELEKMSVSEKQKALKLLKAKCEIATEWVNKSIQSFMMNGRKMNQSVCVVSHKPNEGRFENKIINEASGVVLFPASIRKNILETFMIQKLSMAKDDAKELMSNNGPFKWFQYDYLYISHRTSRQFAIGVDFIKLF